MTAKDELPRCAKDEEQKIFIFTKLAEIRPMKELIEFRGKTVTILYLSRVPS